MSPSYDVHRPEFEGTTTESWSAPSVAAYDASDPAELADNFLLSASGFPPEDTEDLALPVVDTGGELNLEALEEARSGVEGVELDADTDLAPATHAKARRLVEKLVQENFEHGDPEAEPKEGRQAQREARETARAERREKRDQEKQLRETEAQETNKEDIPPDQDSSG